MTLPQTNTNDCNASPLAGTGSTLPGLKFILVETSRPGNIGAAARAMKTMGFTQLVLVRPRFADATSDPEAIAFASGAQDVLQAAQVVDSIEEALAGCNFAAAVSARLREFSPPVIAPRALAAQLATAVDCQAALVFGNERFGLPNTIVEKCNVLINIPANTAYSSLNLAQAVQVVAYECALALQASASYCASHGLGAADGGDAVHATRLFVPHGTTAAASDAATNASAGIAASARTDTRAGAGAVGFQGQAADLQQVEALYVHLEEALVALAFLDPANPKKLMTRLRRMFSRAGLEVEEVNILRGIASRILRNRQP